MPNISSSLWILGAPYSGFSWLIRRKLRISQSILGDGRTGETSNANILESRSYATGSQSPGVTITTASRTDGKSGKATPNKQPIEVTKPYSRLRLAAQTDLLA